MPFRRQRGIILDSQFPLADPSDPINKGLVSGYMFSEGAGAVVHDITRNNNSGIWNYGGIWATGGDHGRHVYMDGTDQHWISCVTTRFITNLTAFTISVNCNSEFPNPVINDYSMFFASGGQGHLNTYFNLINGNGGHTGLGFYSPATNSWFSNNVASVTGKHRWTLSYSNGTLSFYQDRTPIGVSTGVPALGAGDPTQGFRIGSDWTGGTYKGALYDLRIWSRALTLREVTRLCSDSSAGLLKPRRRIINGVSGGPPIGTLAVTEAADAISAVAIVGAMGTSIGFGGGAYGIGPYVARVITSALAVTQAAQTLSAAGLVRVSGTLSQTQAAQTLSATATVRISGALAATQANQTIVAAAGVGVTAVLAVTEAPDTIAAAAKGTITGTLIVAQAAETLAASGSVLSGIVGGLGLFQAPQTLTAAGTAPLVVSGTLNTAQGPHVLVAAGGVAVRGTLAVTQAAATISATGGARVGAALSQTQAAQTISATGVILTGIGAALNVTQAAQTLVAAGSVPRPGFVPGDIAGLTVWLDASQLALADGAGVSPWPDLSGNGNNGTITGTPPPVVRANALNGKRVVRFKPNEGMVRGNTGIGASGLPAPFYNYTVIYVTRTVGPTVGRAFSGLYPATNFLIGFHSSGMDTAYDGSGFLVPANAYNIPTVWKLYGMTGSHDGTVAADTFYGNGVALGSAGGGTGLQDRYNLSGYDATGVQESCDCEVAELLIYNHPLPDADRIEVENYLRVKWLAVSTDIIGTLSVTQAAQTLSATGTAASNATLVVTEALDTVAASGTVRVSGVLSRTQASQTITAAASVRLAGTLAVTEATDTIAAIAGAGVRATLVIVQNAQTLAATGRVLNPVLGVLGVTQQDQTLDGLAYPHWSNWAPCHAGAWIKPGGPPGYGRLLFGAGPFGGVKSTGAPVTGTWSRPGVCGTGTWRQERLAA